MTLTAAAASGAAVAVVATWLRWRGWAVWLLSVLAAVLLTASLGIVTLAGRVAEGSDAFVRVGQGWLAGPAQMLTANLPLDSEPAGLAFMVTVTQLAAICAGLLTLRGSSVVLPVLPPLVVLIGSVAVAASAPRTPAIATVGFVLLAAATIVTRARARTVTVKRAMKRRLPVLGAAARVGLPLVLLSVVALPVMVLHPWTSDGQRADPRRLVSVTLQARTPVSPLSRIKVQLLALPAPLFDVEAIAGSVGDRVRLTSLDAFDGMVWTSSNIFNSAGHHFFADATVQSPRRTSVRITISGMEGPYLPVVGEPLELSDVLPRNRTLGVNTSSGTLIDVDGVRPGFTYTLSSQMRTSDSGLENLTLSVNPGLTSYVALPSDVPAELRSFAGRFVAGGEGPYRALKAMEAHLRSLPYRLDDVPAGHSYAAVDSLLGLASAGTGPVTPAGGFAEQRASAFALLARLDGIPARVAVGYRLVGGGSRLRVTTRQAHAWPEAYFPGYGWIPFEPTDVNQVGTPTAPPSIGSTQQAPPPTARPQIADSPRPPPLHPPVVPTSPAEFRVPRDAWLLLGSAPVLTLLALSGAKYRRRRRRRRSPEAADRVRGAWREAMDRLSERGYREQPQNTPADTAVAAGEVFIAVQTTLQDLAGLAAVAVYSPGESDEHDATRAWRLERDLWRALNAGRVGVLRRLRCVVDPRPLWRTRLLRRQRAAARR